jgi:hypothetical protein
MMGEVLQPIGSELASVHQMRAQSAQWLDSEASQRYEETVWGFQHAMFQDRFGWWFDGQFFGGLCDG